MGSVPSQLIFILQHYWRLHDQRLSDFEKWSIVTSGLLAYAEFIRIEGENNELCGASSTPEDEPLPRALKYLAEKIGGEVLKNACKYSCEEIASTIERAVRMIEEGEIEADFDEALNVLARFLTRLATILMRRYQVDAGLLMGAEYSSSIKGART